MGFTKDLIIRAYEKREKEGGNVLDICFETLTVHLDASLIVNYGDF